MVAARYRADGASVMYLRLDHLAASIAQKIKINLINKFVDKGCCHIHTLVNMTGVFYVNNFGQAINFHLRVCRKRYEEKEKPSKIEKDIEISVGWGRFKS